jgi:REP element-mobilizing transposase RayT
MPLYGEKDRASRPVLQMAMPRLPRIYSPGATMHVVARCNNREFYFAAPDDFEILLGRGDRDVGSKATFPVVNYEGLCRKVGTLVHKPPARQNMARSSILVDRTYT